jgi:selenocysteine lyase/cysteine desulfurase
MACVELPPSALPPGAAPAGAAADAPCAATSAHAKAVQDALFARGVEAPVKCLPATGVAGGDNMRLFVRISAAVYNEAADYDKLADAVEALTWEEEGAAADDSNDPTP